LRPNIVKNYYSILDVVRTVNCKLEFKKTKKVNDRILLKENPVYLTLIILKS